MKKQILFLGSFLAVNLVANVALNFVVQNQAFADQSNQPTACIINFETRAHFLSTELNKKFSNSKNQVQVINEAAPTDIIKCIDAGASSITILAHAGDLNVKGQHLAPLAFVSELTGQAREDYINQIMTELDKQVADFYRKVRTNTMKATEGALYYRILEADQKFKKSPKDKPIYGQPEFIDGQLWKTIASNPKNLKKINIVSCLPEMVREYYPELNELEQQGIEIQFAPKNKFWSFVFGKNVTSPDLNWMQNELF